MMNCEWTNLLGNLVLGLLGISAAVLPVCLFFFRHDALYDMLYGTSFTICCMQKISLTIRFPGAFSYFFFLFLPGVAAICEFWKKWKKERNRAYLSLGLTVILTYRTLVYTNVYIRYFLLGSPLFTVAAAAVCSVPGDFCLSDL